jgi:hypothetical protein
LATEIYEFWKKCCVAISASEFGEIAVAVQTHELGKKCCVTIKASEFGKMLCGNASIRVWKKVQY